MRRAVICDFGGVLTTPLGNAFAAWSRESGIAIEDVGQAMTASTERHGEHPLFLLEKGQIQEREFARRLEAELFLLEKGQIQEREFARRLEAELDGEWCLDTMADIYFRHLERNIAMIEYMAELRGRGLRMALLTNNVREWEATWRAMLPELDEIFEIVVDSAFVGMRKPERGIYQLTVERLGGGLKPSDCVFVDDVRINCDAARDLGMAAVVFESAEQAREEIEEALLT